MSTVTPNLNLVKPDPLEAFSRATYNNNLEIIDANAVQYSKENSTLDATNFNCTSSTFVRLRTGNQGIIVAKIAMGNKVALALPTNTAGMFNVGIVAPAGYRPKENVNVAQAIQSGAGRGDEVQVWLLSTGALGIRGNSATVLTTTVGAAIYWNLSYEWDGVL